MPARAIALRKSETGARVNSIEIRNTENVLHEIPEVSSSHGAVRITLTAKLNAQGRPAFFWSGREGAPTLRVKPGDHIRISFRNLLPQFCTGGIAAAANLHFHGLHSAPTAPGDEVILTRVAPGATAQYDVAINPTQPPGMYWYHPHAHGLSAYEVGNGMAGVILVEGLSRAVPRTAGLHEQVIVLGDLPRSADFQPPIARIPPPEAVTAGLQTIPAPRRGRRGILHIVSILPGAKMPFGVTVPSNDGDGALNGKACRAETDGTPTINGARFAVISLDPDRPELFRVLNASAHRHYDLSFDNVPFDIVAQDGVPIDFFPGAPRSLRVRHAIIPPAGRLEFLIRGRTRPLAMSSLCFDAGPAGDANPALTFGVLTTRPASTGPVHIKPPMPALLQTGYYLRPLPRPSMFRTVHFQEEHGRFYLDGSSYEARAPINMIAHSGTVEAWDLENDTPEVHVFHIHQTHFVVQSVNGVRPVTPHWMDTVDLPPERVLADGSTRASHVNVIVDFRDPRIRGIFFYHCHILDHEDSGMMARIEVR